MMFTMKGFVYLLFDGELYKIGVTRGDINKRIKKLQTGNPYSIVLIDSYQTNFPFQVEKMLHNRFVSKKVNNEWFDLSLEDVNNFQMECKKASTIIEALKDNPFFK